MTRRGWALLAAWGAVVGGGGLVAAHDAPPGRDLAVSETPRLAVIREAPDFTLTDTDGRRVQLSAFHGQVVLVAFIYASCADACPLLTQRMRLVRDQLREARVDDRAVFLSVTVDPERDTADVLRQYAGRFGGASAGWRFLAGEPAQVRSVLDAYDEWTRREPAGSLDHPARLYLIDGRGRVREIYGLAFFNALQAYLDIRALLGEAS